MQVMNFLLQQPELDVNAVNSNNLKTLDILLKGPKQSNDEEIVHMLHLASMPKLKSQALTDPSRANDAVIEVDMTMKDSASKKDTVDSFKWLEEMPRGTMVAVVLIATVTFKVALNPPGGSLARRGKCRFERQTKQIDCGRRLAQEPNLVLGVGLHRILGIHEHHSNADKLFEA